MWQDILRFGYYFYSRKKGKLTNGYTQTGDASIVLLFIINARR